MKHEMLQEMCCSPTFKLVVLRKVAAAFEDSGHPRHPMLHLLWEQEQCGDGDHVSAVMHVYRDRDMCQHLGWVFIELMGTTAHARDKPQSSAVWRLEQAQKVCRATHSAARLTVWMAHDPGAEHIVQCTALSLGDVDALLRKLVADLRKNLPPMAAAETPA